MRDLMKPIPNDHPMYSDYSQHNREIVRLAARIQILESALRHADEALFWHKGLAFELDGKTVGEVIEAALPKQGGGA